MKRVNAILVLITICLLGMSATVIGDWVFLGERTVNKSLDRDEILVTAKRGEFNKLKFKVKRAAVEFHKVVVVYGNGERMEVEMRSKIKPGSETRAIDLRATDRVIKKVIFYYDTDSITKKRGVVRLFGMR